MTDLIRSKARHEFEQAASYTMPPEWVPHEATWLSYPHAAYTWPGGIEHIFDAYNEFVRIVSTGEKVHILLQDKAAVARIGTALTAAGAVMANIVLHDVPTNDAWCRDHGPCFVFAGGHKGIVNWGFNAWGGKYPYTLDDQVPGYVARYLDVPQVHPGLIMEGGSIEVNGDGVLMTTESCLLNPNRNPPCSRTDLDIAMRRFYGVRQIIWLGDGIAGDDTDGHIDDMTRFVSPARVVTAVEQDPSDVNYAPLRHNREILRRVRLPDGAPLEVVELPMPDPVVYDGQRLPASYANFYIANAAVIMPTFRCERDAVARDILQGCFERPVIGVDAYNIIQGLGSFHCLSRQEPQ
ncbi:MAG TPA: agmatine deiminase [Verrucomicrobia bacterium]|nr:agmatine deiminase [Verrucomicrobiota bacterium]